MVNLATSEDLVALHKKLDAIAAQVMRMSSNNSGPDYYTTETLSKSLGLSKRTLQSWRDQGIIGYSQIGRIIIYSKQNLADLLSDHANELFSDTKEKNI